MHVIAYRVQDRYAIELFKGRCLAPKRGHLVFVLLKEDRVAIGK
jgi:hypothetical protein